MQITEVPIVKSQSLAAWLDVFYACHNQGLSGLTQWCWPDNKSYYEQVSYLPQMFNLIKQQIAIAIKQKTPNKAK